jgi:uncharacterized protein YciI
MKNEPEKIKQVVQSHIAYWKDLNLNNSLDGPFADRSGGLITFDAVNLDEATHLVSNDPFIRNNLIEKKWLKEWVVE